MWADLVEGPDVAGWARLLQDLPYHEGLTQLPHQLRALLMSCWAFEVLRVCV